MLRTHRFLVAHEVEAALIGDREYRLGTTNLSAVRMSDFHRVHVGFLCAILELKSELCLVESLAWSYRALIARGLSEAALLKILLAWPVAIRRVLADRVDTRHLEGLYEAVVNRHQALVSWALEPEPELEVPDRFRAPFDAFVNALLDADAGRAEDVIVDNVAAAAEIPVWWQEVVAPALHRVGRLWALTEIDEAQEHIATATAYRAMIRTFPRLPRPRPRHQTVAVVVSPGEIHEIGASMVRDALDLAGFDTLFTGGNTPAETLLPLIENNDIVCVMVSTTLALNLPGTSTLIRSVRDLPKAPPVVVGGQAYRWDPDLWRHVGADAHENDLHTLLSLVDTLVA